MVDLGTLDAVMADVVKLGIWTGWQTLQRLVYIAAFMALLHWITIHKTFGGALAHLLPLAVLETYRVWKVRLGGPADEVKV